MFVLLSILLVGTVLTSEPAVQATETQRAEEIELASSSLANFSTEFKLAFSNPGTEGPKQNTHVLLYMFDWPGVHVNRVLSGLPSLREMMTAINLHIGLLTLNRTEILKGGEQAETIPGSTDVLERYFPSWRDSEENERVSRLTICDSNNSCTGYQGPPSFTALIEWVRRQVRPKVQFVKNAEEAKEKRSGEPMALFVTIGEKGGLSSEKDVQSWLEDLEIKYPNVTMLMNSGEDPNQIKRLPSVRLFRDFDLGPIDFPRSNLPAHDVTKILPESFTPESIENWLKRESDAVMIQFDSGKHANRLFGEKGLKTLVIYSPFVVTKEIDAEIRTFFKSAIKYRELLNIVQARFGTENGNALYQYMGRPFSNRTEVWIFEKTEDGINKYPMIDLEAQQASSTEEPLPQGAPLSETSLAAFIESYLAGSLLPELKTQPAPTAEELASSPDYLSFLVGKTLPPVVSSSKTPILVLFFSTSCEYSMEFAPIFDEIASQLHPTGKVRFGVIEGTKNQVRGLPVEGFPAVFLFRGQNTDKQSDDKDNETEGKTSGWELENTRFVEGLGEVVEFWGQRTRLSLLAFIRKELSHVSLVEVLGEKESNEVEAQFKIEYEGGEDSMEVQFDEEEINRLLEEQIAEQNAEKDTETPESIAKDVDTDL